MDVDLNGMDLDRLRALRKQVDQAIASFETRRKREAMDAVEKAAREHGFALADLTGAGGGRGRGRGRKAGAPDEASAPRYAHPDDPSQTWSGRGRRPRWVTEQVAAGRDLSEFAV
ncbi:H-NS family nucleoid-associated regulatory protein [Paracoccus luteus]|uniref:H-NS histone family protein n=1 Tax=Paracoccus luteus TaxID=2508543 RepID=UPI00106FC7D0|nr:H-NS histone family protein [Paracoccus luteus]